MNTLFAEKNKNKFLILILLLALAVRLWVFPVVFSNGGVTLLGADTYYHARRILATVANFPSTLSFDSYINFPYGARIGWAPLYDQFTALIALMVGVGSPSFYTIEATAAFIPLLLGVLTVYLVFLITQKLFDWRVGLISAGIFAITPAHVYVSFLGYADHHVAETLISTADYLLLIIALEHLQKNNISFRNFKTDIIKNSSYPALTGIALAISLFTWEGASIFIGLIGIYILIQFIIDRRLERSSDYLIITGATAFLVSLLIITPVAVSQGMGFDIFNSYLPSLFHVGFLAVFFFLCVLLGVMQRLQFKKWWYNLLLLFLILIAAVFSLEILSPQFYQSLTNGIQYLFGGGILATIEEALPLFNTPEGGFTLDNVWRAFTLSFFIALISFIYFIYKTTKEKYPFKAVFLIVWTLIVLVLTILQRRFIYLFAVNVAIFSAYFIIAAAKQFAHVEEKEATTPKKKRKKQRQYNSETNKGLIIGISLLFLLTAPNIPIIKYYAEGIAAPDQDLRDSFKWLKDNSPPTSYYYAPDKPAEYGVMSWWDYGNWILYLSQRPVVSNNFQTGIDDAAHFLITPDEKAADDILNKRKVRFIVTDAQMLKLKFSSIAMLAGRDPLDYYGTSDGAPIRSVNNENGNFFATMLSRLHVFDGDGLSHYRLIYESNTTAIRNPDIKYVKIFEYVPGATLSGRAGDGEVKVTLNVMTNQGRTFVYTQRAVAMNGNYEIKVPYSTQGGKYGTKPSGDYIIQNANVSKMVAVSEQDVLDGRRLQVDLI
ncbi:MAG: oligosaccharyl transferase, archaeosortase A system-associated [Candidatus Methanoperedens sp.]|nr:oligosaccharyl transferase, archaeosortase A system-associated [Candidatus Methanoperedens sp.]